MADNVAITAGAGTTVATDDVGGAHYQKNKLVDGTADSSTPVAAGDGGKANALRVVLADDEALPAGTNKLGGVDLDSDATIASAVPSVGQAVAGSDGTNARLLKTDTSGELQVDVLTLPNATVVGKAAHGAAVDGNPVLLAGEGRSSLATAVDSGDVVRLMADLFGRLLTGHIDPAQQVWKSAAFTTAQTGTDIWTPASTKKIAITSFEVGIGGTTGGVVTLWIGASGDTAYTAGTDQLIGIWNVIPSATIKTAEAPLGRSFYVPIFAATADYRLKLTTSAGITIDLAVYGYEF